MSKLFVIGDTHGDLGPIYNWIAENKDATLIHVGDACIPWIDLERLAYKLSKKNLFLYIVRGNHESTEYTFDGQQLNSNGNLILVKDYSLHKICNKEILFIGGGISLDRVWRKRFKIKHPNKENWYSDKEALVYRPELIKKGDILITHTTHEKLVSKSDPNFPRKFAEHDFKLLDDLEIERKNILAIYDDCVKLGYKQAFFGHFHSSEHGEYKGMEYKGLNINEITQVI